MLCCTAALGRRRGEHTAVLQLHAREVEALLIGWDAHSVPDLRLRVNRGGPKGPQHPR